MAAWTARRILLTAIAIASGTLAVPPASGGTFDPGRNPHAHFRQPEQCPKCHFYKEGKPAPDRILAESDTFCLGCHVGHVSGRNHPRGVRPPDARRGVRIPDDFRLDLDGRIVCVTCHTGHGAFVAGRKAHPSQRPENSGNASADAPSWYRTFYLRRSDPKDGFAVLCGACHGSP